MEQDIFETFFFTVYQQILNSLKTVSLQTSEM